MKHLGDITKIKWHEVEPNLWEQINGKDSARWASEIEEFPMAVTKLRLGED